jgi:hypothetical protein
MVGTGRPVLRGTEFLGVDRQRKHREETEMEAAKPSPGGQGRRRQAVGIPT